MNVKEEIIMLEEELFKRSHPSYNKIEKYGFIKSKDNYLYQTSILDNSFKVLITITSKGKVLGKIIDQETNEEYLNFRTNMQGEFVNKVRNTYEELLKDIRKNCFTTDYFMNNQANRITKYIEEKYHISPSFLWDNLPYAGVFKNKNNKWFGIIMNINYSKLNNKEGMVDIINLKINPDKILKLLEKNGYYKAYHMNKISWITLTLDDTIIDREIEELIDESYENIIKPNNWLIPANPKYYDIINAFNNTNIITWKQSSNIEVGDIIYLYVAEPYSKIFYKCRAVEVDIPYTYQDKNLKIDKVMKIELLENLSNKNYNFKYLNSLGIKAIRGPRKINENLIKKLS